MAFLRLAGRRAKQGHLSGLEVFLLERSLTYGEIESGRELRAMPAE
jgi:hypothetical protein